MICGSMTYPIGARFCLQLIDKLSVRTPTGEVKLKLMKEIAKEYQIEWNSTESEAELLKPAEERIVCIFPPSLSISLTRTRTHNIQT